MYALFAGRDEYPQGGFNDIVAIGKTWEELLKMISHSSRQGWLISQKSVPRYVSSERSVREVDWWHVVDLSTVMIVRSNLFAEGWDWFEKEKFGIVDGFYKKMSRAEKPTERTQV